MIFDTLVRKKQVFISITYGLSILLAAALLFIGIRFYQQQQHPSTRPSINVPSQAPARMAIQGFHYTARQNGHMKLSIHADRMALKKKKVAMLRFGLLNEVFFTNARIEINARTFEQLEPQNDSVSLPPKSIFKDAFNIKSINNLSMKKVAGIHFTPVDLCLTVDDHREVRVTANSASVKITSGAVEFKGNVRWNRGRTTIKSEFMIASLEDNTLLVPRKYSIDREGKIIWGHHLRSDLLLSDIVSLWQTGITNLETNQRYWKTDIKQKDTTYAGLR